MSTSEHEASIRKAELRDADDVLRITESLHLDMPEFVWSTEPFVRRQIDHGQYFVAEKEGRVVGIISFRQRGEKMYIETISVSKESQANGIGKKLIEFAKSYTKEKGLRKLVACSFYEYQMKDFYFKQGFSLLWRRGSYNGHKFFRFEITV